VCVNTVVCVQNVLTSPHSLRHDVLHKCMQHMEQELSDLAGGLHKAGGLGGLAGDVNRGGHWLQSPRNVRYCCNMVGA
jgi:hypothetical protein